MIGKRLIKFLERISGHILIDQIDSIHPFYNLISFIAGLKLKKLSARCKNLDDFYNLIKNFNYSNVMHSNFIIAVKFYQKKDEILNFIRSYSKFNPKIILEIGTYDGGTLFFLSKFANPNATIITMDLPFIRDGVGYTPARIPFYKSLKTKKQKIFFLRENSHSAIAKEKVEKILKNRKIDVLFIDGDHSYKGVKQDFEIFSPLVKTGGMIAFHDIIEHPPDSICKVSDFWNEIKEKYEFQEFFSNIDEKWAGIGVIIH